jgi:hypothetical protein
MPPGHQGQATEPTKSAMDQLPSGFGSGAELVGGALGAGVGHASTVRPDPSTLGVGGDVLIINVLDRLAQAVDRLERNQPPGPDKV